MSLLKKLFSSGPSREKNDKEFKFVICNDKKETPLNTWHHLKKWKSQNFLLMNTSYTKDWVLFNAQGSLNSEEEVAGTYFGDRKDAFLIMGDAPDFKLYLEREPNNPKDKNAIKVMAMATVNGDKLQSQIGYVSKESALLLKDEVDIDVRPYSVYLPYKDSKYKLYIRILVRSARYKNKVDIKEEHA